MCNTNMSLRLGSLLALCLLVMSLIRTGEAPASPPTIEFPVRVVQVSDDDGRREASISKEEVAHWVDFANRVFRDARIRFRFDASEWSYVRSTLLNKSTGVEDVRWRQERSYGNRVAAAHAGRLVVLVRFGQARNQGANGFSSWDYNFIAMAGGMRHCGHEHVDAFAHEAGHYLGLTHTFVKPFDTVRAAENYLRSKANNPAAFDGDGLSDTPPDPCIRMLECPRTGRIVLNGVPFVLPRDNIMSYYDERRSLSRQQAARAWWMARTRRRNGFAVPTNRHVRAPIEAEGMQVVDARSCGPSPQSMKPWADHLWSHDAQLFCGASLRGSVTLALPVASRRHARLVLYATQAPDFGVVQVSLDGGRIGPPFDGYAPLVLPSGPSFLGVVDLLPGSHRLNFEVTGKNAASSGYNFGIDCIALE